MTTVSPSLVVIASIVLGCAVGSAFTAALIFGRQLGKKRAERIRPAIPDSALDVLEQLPEAALLLDSSLTIVYANPQARDQQSGLRNSMFEGAEFLQEMRKVIRHGAPYLHLADGNANTTRMRAFRVKKRFVAVLVDDVGEQQRLDNMRRDFIANVSHELKTPISAIGLLAEAIEQAGDDPEFTQHLAATMRTEVGRLGELSRDIIHLSEAQSDLSPRERTPVDLRELVQTQVDEHASYAETCGVSVVVAAPAEKEQQAVLLGRKSSLNIAVANILTNAIRHSVAGSTVGVGMTFTPSGFDVAISDHGPGIAPEFQGRVFERFFRVDDSRTRASGGTGLGLSIVKHTMRTHGGDVTLWSQPGVGATFTLHFPLHDELAIESSIRQTKRKKNAKAHSAR
jgi:two-component system sensor histidine kinase SenX3